MDSWRRNAARWGGALRGSAWHLERRRLWGLKEGLQQVLAGKGSRKAMPVWLLLTRYGVVPVNCIADRHPPCTG